MVKNIFNLLFSNILFGFTQFLIIISLNKFGGLEEVGQYTLALGIVAPIAVLLNMGLRIHYNTNKDNDGYKNYEIIRFVSSGLLIIFAIIICLLLNYELSTSLIILLVASLKSIESILELNYGFLQKKELHNLIAKSKNIRSISLILWILLCFFVLNGNLIVLLTGLILFNITFYLVFDLKYLYKLKDNYKVSISIMKKIVFTSLPLAIATTIDTLNINIQRVFLNYYVGIEEVGIYASITTMMVTGQLIMASVMTYFLPKLNQLIIAKNFKKFKNLLIILVIIASIIGLFIIAIVMLYGQWLLSIIFTEQYIPYKNLAVLIMFVGMFWYVAGALNLAVVALNEYRKQMIAIILSFLAMLLTTVITINDLELYGAAFGLIIGMIIRIIAFTMIIVRKIRG